MQRAPQHQIHDRVFRLRVRRGLRTRSKPTVADRRSALDAILLMPAPVQLYDTGGSTNALPVDSKWPIYASHAPPMFRTMPAARCRTPSPTRPKRQAYQHREGWQDVVFCNHGDQQRVADGDGDKGRATRSPRPRSRLCSPLPKLRVRRLRMRFKPAVTAPTGEIVIGACAVSVATFELVLEVTAGALRTASASRRR